ncbi:MAG: peptidylprolyl isomerase [Bacteroidaceae bacterium]
MENSTNLYITVAYQLHTKAENGELILREETTEEHPFAFISGLEFTLPRFEQELVSRNKGDRFEFVIPCDDAYGDYFPEGVHELNRKEFFGDDANDERYVYEGAVIPLFDSEGHRHNGLISKLTPDTVTIDLNHPYAGKDLHFSGTVVDVRPATNKEIEDMVKAMSGGCGGGCGSCGGDCGGSCGGGCGDCE